VAPRLLDLRARTRCVELRFSVMGAVHSKGRARLVNGKVRKLTAIVTNTKMLEEAAKPGFGKEEVATVAVVSDSVYASDTDDEEDLARIDEEEKKA
jgi:hypothetical protein